MLLRNGELYSGNKVRTCAASQGFENFQFANNQIFVERNIIEFCQFTITAKHLWILGHLKFHLLECMQRKVQHKQKRENPLYKTYLSNVNSLELVFKITQHRWFKSEFKITKHRWFKSEFKVSKQRWFKSEFKVSKQRWFQ